MKKIIISFVLVMSILAISVYAQSTINQTKPSRSEPIKISEQQHKILSEKIKTDLDEMLQEGSISKEQHEYLTSQVERGILRGFGKNHPMENRGKNKVSQMTDEQKAQITEKIKTELLAKLEEGKITKEEYEEKIASVEKGDFKGFVKGRKGRPSFVNSDGSMPDFSIDSAGCRGNMHRITHREMKE